MSNPVFGKALRKDFSFEPGYIPLGHGSFGAIPNVVKQKLREYQDKSEAHPDRWNRFEMIPVIESNLVHLSKLINCDAQDISFVSNSSEAASVILRSYPFKAGDKVLHYQTAYVNVNKALEFIRDQYGVQLITVELNYPLEDQEIVELTKQAIEAEHAKLDEPKIKLAVIDGISAVPAVLFPFQAVTKLVQEHDILAMIDGAHTVGQIDVDIKAFDPDFFFSNCHKWLMVPRGSCVLYVAKRNQGYVHPTTITFAYKHHADGLDTSTFKSEFIPPTIDTSNYMCVEEALKYRASLGGEETIREYTHNIAVEGGAFVAKMLGTQVLENSTNTLTASMVNVELPPFTTTLPDSEVGAFIMKKLIYEHHTMAATYKNNGKWYTRFCGQVYIDLDDFEHAGKALLVILEELNKQ
ncbi:pyridoxal phosphate-dependent transferase [Parasitella parasitica]|nr:pyridoxal phosphate-dependent transferase [Parasitella parasitica]